MGRKFYYHRKWCKETPAEYALRCGILEHRRVKFITHQLVQKNGAVCAICGKQITNKKDLTLDHVRPRSKGGLTTLENCQLACRKCNHKKGDQWIAS